ncbi:MAG: hypothetical protein GFH27_549285n62 [Chloroflexi bacterium AL-W]|nr:hypothetical protein [Chloroflexi bacterium AL-N1]NOK65574.1 hypothetical protein [Chloroflexi bacterium AL-N10]NOK74485.1 hypothetical protein [Chloroflexi bacterium AL-N5]NOK80607.1 hypothetical protein [Chloroflexi bacterium AL-W]NOK88743.1 hypothetical protein [Chloroflexi bacterium AL-N15]
MIFGSTLTGHVAQAQNNGLLTQKLIGDEARLFVTLAQESAHFRSFAKRLTTEYSQQFSFDPQQVEVTKMVYANEATVVVKFPINGGAGYSHYSVMINPETHHKADEVALLFTEDSDGNIDNYIERNGQSLAELKVTKDGEIIHSTNEGLGYPTTTDRSVDSENAGAIQSARCDVICCLNGCLSSQGIPGWVLAGLGFLCGALCLGTIGARCGPCLATGLGIVSSTASFCAQQCIVERVPYNDCVGGC